MQTVGCSVLSNPLDISEARPWSIHTFAARLDRMPSVQSSLCSCADICEEVVGYLHIKQLLALFQLLHWMHDSDLALPFIAILGPEHDVHCREVKAGGSMVV